MVIINIIIIIIILISIAQNNEGQTALHVLATQMITSVSFSSSSSSPSSSTTTTTTTAAAAAAQRDKLPIYNNMEGIVVALYVVDTSIM
jgi:hypothetical protein